MNTHFLIPVLRALRACLHLLVGALLGLAAASAVADRRADAVAVVAAAAVFAAVYGAGSMLPRVRASTGAARAWLAAVMAMWAVLLVLTPDAVWLAFPLYFLQLHLLPARSGPAAVAATTAAAISGFSWHTGTVNPGMVIGPVLGASVAVATVLGYQALYRESEQRRRLIEQLTAARNDLAAAEHTAGVLAERERLAREIHDTLAQGLSSIQLLLRAAERVLPDDAEAALGHVRHARRTAADNLAEARRFVRALAPPDLEAGPLPAALQRLCATTGESCGLAVDFQLSGRAEALPTPLEVALLRIAQSALANTVQHAAATHAEMTLSYLGGRVALDIIDDGRGFTPGEVPAPSTDPAAVGGFGLAAMRSRVRALHGTFAVESAPGEGTAVAVTLPVPTDASPQDTA